MSPLYEISPSYGTYYISIYVEMLDATTGDLKPNVAHTDLTVRSTTNRRLPVAVTTAAIAAPDTALSVPRTTLGWVQVDATNCPGLYRADLPDILFSPTPDELAGDNSIANTGNSLFECILTIRATNCKTQHIRFQFVANAKNRPIILDVLGYPLAELHIADGSLALAMRNFFMGYQNYLGAVTATVPTGTVGVRLAPAGVDSIMVESGINLRQATQTNLAYAAGVSSGAGTGTRTFKDPSGTYVRIVATAPGTGDRTLVTLTNT